MNGLYIKGLKTSIKDVLLWRANDQYIPSTARVFAIINLSINVFIYCVFNKKFKTTFCYLFWKCLAQNKNVPSGTINSNSKDGLSSKRTNMMHKYYYLINFLGFVYRISANSFRGNYSFFGSWSAESIQGRKLFKGGNY